MNTVIIVAAGQASRMKGIDKIFTRIDGIPVLLVTLKKFEASDNIHNIIVVVQKEKIEEARLLISEYNITKVGLVIEGGKTRQDSVKNGVYSCPKDTDILLVHDGARPFVETTLIDNIINSAKKHNAVIPVVPVIDTIKVVENENITDTPNRENLYIAQTPQAFSFEQYVKVLDTAIEKGLNFTDDSQLLEMSGYNVHTICGSYKNVKITTQEDLKNV